MFDRADPRGRRPATWRAFHEGRSHRRAVAPERHVERWSRSQRLGASWRGDPIDDALIRGEAFRLHAEHVDVVQSLGSVALARAAGQVSAHDFVLLLADADGVVVRSDGGGEFRDEARRVRLIEGAAWSEAARGTNAIGTAASERRPTVVLGRAHFAASYHQLACYAAPILDLHGRVVGVLDATSAVERDDASDGLRRRGRRRARARRGVAGAFARSRWQRTWCARWCARSNTSPRPAVLVELPGRIARMNAAMPRRARCLALHGVRAWECAGREVFGADFGGLLARPAATTWFWSSARDAGRRRGWWWS
ncbi:MAG: GAF domain-containing protein [Planctomycetes bacterium]|nr:GAF domain-containing protein [Planctomycetota bacterium]